MNQGFVFSDHVDISFPEKFYKPVYEELWHNFCYTGCEGNFILSEESELIIGSPCKNSEIDVLTVSTEGVYMHFSDRRILLDAYFELLQKIIPVNLEEGKEELFIPAYSKKYVRPAKVKMIHLCLMPKTSLLFFRKSMRLAGFLGYTHLIVEFWGTYRFRCMEELGWPDYSYTREEIMALFEEARAFGMEIIPMMNLFGHASGCSHAGGKHVALDQNPRLAPYFSADGWCFNIQNEKVMGLLRGIREELYELCGEGEYFHIGCDEGYTYMAPEYKEIVGKFLNRITSEVVSEGRRPIMWGDMLMHRESLPIPEEDRRNYACFAYNYEYGKVLLDSIHKKTIIADWQYCPKQAPLVSTRYLMEAGFDVIVCPWNEYPTIECAVETMEQLDTFGIMQTTWGDLDHKMDIIYYTMLRTKEKTDSQMLFDLWNSKMRIECATLTRKLMRTRKYEDAGWCRK